MSDVQVQEPRSGSSQPGLDISLQLSRQDTEPGARHGEPVRLGVPMPRGRCAADAAIVARDAAGAAVPVQTCVLETWSDGSARWLLVDLRLDSDSPHAECTLSIAARSRDTGAASAASAVAAFAREEGGGVTIDTGAARFRIDPRGPFPFADVAVAGGSVLSPAASGLSVQDEQGSLVPLQLSSVRLEEAGPVRAVVLVEGTFRKPDNPTWLTLIARLHFTRGLAHVECHVTLRNPKRAAHPGGLWDLGDAGSVLFKDASLTWQLATATAAATAGATRPLVRYSAEVGAPFADAGELLELYQDSSGGENWRSPNHLNRNHEIPLSFRGYRLTTARGEQTGLRATPIVSLSAGGHAVAVAVREFWQNCPKAIDAGRDGLTLRLFPKQFADLHELQGGEQKTHTFVITFGSEGLGLDLDPVTRSPLTWARTPLRVHPSPAWYSEAEAVPYLTPRAKDENARYLELVDQAIDGADTFIHKREVIDQYGWRHFGDLYGDHEAVREPAGAPPLISHYNNQYDVIGGFTAQFMRSGDWRWKLQADEMAAHVTDIDLYHTDQDKAAYNHGLFWHTYHYVDVDTGTHRSYPAKFRHIVHGGGPSSEQNYATGLMLHYFMTGNPLSRDAAIGLARFVFAIDDGNQTVFRWFDRGYTGLASASGNMDYHGPGRGPGNSVAALLDGHRLTRDRAFLDKAEQLIRRCIHPADDLAARNLLDAERRWYYTMFLQALGKFLDHKIELGELDDAYAYGRESLLHYARWMAEYEHPYLDKPEILEYPTETWPAQDMRKSQVFKFAARHAATVAEQTRFMERAQFFFDYSTRTLAGMKTRALARPVVLLLSNGFMHAWFQQRTDIAAPAPRRALPDPGRPQAFVPQRIRAKKRAVAFAAAGALVGLACAAVLLWWLL